MVGGALQRCCCVCSEIIGTASSSFSGFSTAMPVLLRQLVSTLGVISTSASSTPVCTVMCAVAGPAVLAVQLPLTVAVVEQPQKRKRVMDPAERAKCWEFPELVGFWEVYAFDGKTFRYAATARRSSCRSRIIVSTGSSGCGGSVFIIIKGIIP